MTAALDVVVKGIIDTVVTRQVQAPLIVFIGLFLAGFVMGWLLSR
jgi:hypothetical protein